MGAGLDAVVGERLLGRIAALGLPTLASSHCGRAVHAMELKSRDATAGAPILLVAGVHGDEPSGVAAVLDFLVVARAQTARWPARTLWVVPVLNPDGVAANRKDNHAGVDLNRNFPARNFSLAHPDGYFPGTAPGSEPESAALIELVTCIDFAAVIAVHAPLACVNPDGPAAGWAARVAQACGWPVRDDIGYPTPGSLGSWLGRDRGKPVLTLELPPGGYDTFRAPARAALLAAVEHAPVG